MGDVNGDGKLDIYYVPGWDGAGQQHHAFILRDDFECQDAPHFSDGIVDTFLQVKGITSEVRKHDNASIDIARVMFGPDFNGDGKSDIFLAPSRGETEENVIYLSKGNGEWSGPIRSAHSSRIDSEYSKALVDLGRFKFADVNGDGKTDLYYVRGRDGEYVHSYINLSLGNGKFSNGIQGVKARVRADDQENGSADVASIYVGDFNGDGRADVARIDPGLHLRLRHQILEFPELLTSVVDGHGAEHRLEYATLTELGVEQEGVDLRDGNHGFSPIGADFYTVGSSSEAPLQYPLMHFHAPLFLVSKWHQPDGLGGFGTTSYRYRNGMLHLLGGGFLGFEEVSSTDLVSGLQSTTYFSHQSFPLTHLGEFDRRAHMPGFVPYAGLPTGSVQRAPLSKTQPLGQSVVVHASTNRFDHWRSHKVYFPHVAESVEKAYEITDYQNAGDSPLPVSSVVTKATYGSIHSTSKAPQDQNARHGNVTRLVVEQYGGNPVGNPHYRTTTVSSYADNTTLWFLGRLTTARVTKEDFVTASPTLTRESSFAYDPQTGVLMLEQMEPTDPIVAHSKEYLRNAFGNIVESLVHVPNNEPRRTKTSFDNDQRMVIEIRNALGHTEMNTYDNRLGVRLSATSANGLTTRWSYDAFGRMLSEERPDGTATRTVYRRFDPDKSGHTTVEGRSLVPQGGWRPVFFVQSDNSQGGMNRVYFDLLGRPILTVTRGFDSGQFVITHKIYNAKGEEIAASLPYLLGEEALYGTNEYDQIGRSLRVVAPGGRVTTTERIHRSGAHANDPPGFTKIRQTNPLGQTQTATQNVRGEAVVSKDNQGNAIGYFYDAYGNPVRIVDPHGNQTLITYNRRGMRVGMVDPDAGSSTLVYNGYGEVIQQTDAAGNTVHLFYDNLGRVLERQEPEGRTYYQYDQQWKGAADRVVMDSANGVSPYSISYRYDPLGRLVETREDIRDHAASSSLISSMWYDEASRLAGLVYPSGLSVSHRYNQNGNLFQVLDTATSTKYWQADEVNCRNQVVRAQLGNAIQTQFQFDPTSGLVSQIMAANADGNFSAPNLQHLAFTFDLIGNLKCREDRLNPAAPLREDFGYDSLNRLSWWEVAGKPRQTAAYDELGNIRSKSGVGNYSYSASRPHAVTHVSGLDLGYQYDAAGNRVRTHRAGVDVQIVEYSSYNKPVRMSQGTMAEVGFAYGPDRLRYLQYSWDFSNGARTTKLYGQNGYEREVGPGEVKHTHHIHAGQSMVAIRTVRQSMEVVVDETDYVLTDHLGSIQTVVDSSGQLKTRLAYDPWGLRRNADTWGPLAEGADISPDRGFTGHEHIEETGLIHMNGRVYDPTIGRFLSPDPFVQDSADLQNLNRYSYVLNNPLSATDPSGYFLKWLATMMFGETAGRIVGIVEAVAIAVVAPHIGITMAVAVAAADAQIEAFAGTLMNGGSFGDAYLAGLKAGAIAGAKAFAANAIGGFFASSRFDQWSKAALTITKAASHGVTQGALTKLGGGKFVHGFAAASVSDAGGSLFDNATIFGDGWEGRIWETAANVMLSGTASKLGGGSFVNGAITGAIVHAFNNERHHSPQSMRDKMQPLSKAVDIQDGIMDYAGLMVKFSPNEWKMISLGLMAPQHFGETTGALIVDPAYGVNRAVNWASNLAWNEYVTPVVSAGAGSVAFTLGAPLVVVGAVTVAAGAITIYVGQKASDVLGNVAETAVRNTTSQK